MRVMGNRTYESVVTLNRHSSLTITLTPKRSAIRWKGRNDFNDKEKKIQTKKGEIIEVRRDEEKEIK